MREFIATIKVHYYSDIYKGVVRKEKFEAEDLRDANFKFWTIIVPIITKETFEKKERIDSIRLENLFSPISV